MSKIFVPFASAVILLATFLTTAHAILKPTELASEYISESRDRMAVAVIKTSEDTFTAAFAYGLQASGSIASPSSTIDVFDVNGHASDAQFGTARANSAGASAKSAANVHYLLFGGGERNLLLTSFSDQVAVYNVDANTWDTLKFSSSRTRVGAATVTVPGGEQVVLFAGGYRTGGFLNLVPSFLNAVVAFNTANPNVLTAFGTLSQARSSAAGQTVSTSNGDVALFAGGKRSAILYSNVVDIYDATNNVWSVQTLSQARTNIATTVVTVDGKQYALFAGGEASVYGASSVIDVYDAEAGEFVDTIELPSPRTEIAACTVKGFYALFAGGDESTVLGFSVYEYVDMYNAITEVWTRFPLENPRKGMSAFSFTFSDNNALAYFAGGANSLSRSDEVTVFAFPEEIELIPCSVETCTSENCIKVVVTPEALDCEEANLDEPEFDLIGDGSFCEVVGTYYGIFDDCLDPKYLCDCVESENGSKYPGNKFCWFYRG